MIIRSKRLQNKQYIQSFSTTHFLFEDATSHDDNFVVVDDDDPNKTKQVSEIIGGQRATQQYHIFGNQTQSSPFGATLLATKCATWDNAPGAPWHLTAAGPLLGLAPPNTKEPIWELDLGWIFLRKELKKSLNPFSIGFAPTALCGKQETAAGNKMLWCGGRPLPPPPS